MSRYRVSLDTTRCRSYGVCTGLVPDVFDTPPGSPAAVLLRDRVGDDELDDIREAVLTCPAQAISVAESPAP